MQFEWDDNKAQSNKAKHKVDFETVRNFDFDTAFYRVDDAMDYGEERWEATGLIGVRLYTLVFTERGNHIRVISLRKATPDEMKDFYER
jgi:uncharacterized DUF497 family protein